MVITDRWPKSGIEVDVTVLESDEDAWCRDETGKGSTGPAGAGGWGMMNVLAGCITVASAAIADAGIDCVDLVAGGVAGIVKASGREVNDQTVAPVQRGDTEGNPAQVIRDPCPCEHREMIAVCVVGYLGTRDELTELWLKGNLMGSTSDTISNTRTEEALIDQAVASALEARLVLEAAVAEAVERRSQQMGTNSNRKTSVDTKHQEQDVAMGT